MSNTANWSYTNVAQVRPVTGRDKWGAKTYGDEYQIACTWIAEATTHMGQDGREFVGRHTIYTEDTRPQYLDEVMFDGSNGWEEIRARTKWDMSFFKETPDFKLVT